MDSSDSGTPSSKERIGAREARRARQESERERRKDRKRGGQPGHQGKGLKRDPDPDEKKDADPPAECRSCKASLDGAAAVGRGGRRSSTRIIKMVTEWALPGLVCACCGTVTFAEPPAGAHAGSVSYGPALNAAAVLLAVTGMCRRSGPRRSSACCSASKSPRAGWTRPRPGSAHSSGRPGSRRRCSRPWPARTCWPRTRPR